MRFSVAGSTGLTWSDYIEAGKAAEELGYYGFYGSDHLMPVADRGGSAERLDPPTAMAGVACHTQTVKLGVLVLANLLRHPVMTAKIFSTLDHISGGRAELGIGSGGSRKEYDVHGIPYPPLAERLERLDEAVQVIKALWTHDVSSYIGQYFSLKEAPFEPPPIQKPHPRIIVGGNNDGTLRIAAKHADEWNVQAGLGTAEQLVARMRIVCGETGRDFGSLRISHQIPILLTDSRAEATRFLERHAAAITGAYRFTLAPGYTSVEDQARGSVLVGGAQEIKEQLQLWLNIGVTHLYWFTPRPFSREPLEQFARQVMIS